MSAVADGDGDSFGSVMERKNDGGPARALGAALNNSFAISSSTESALGFSLGFAGGIAFAHCIRSLMIRCDVGSVR